ncbi:MAG: gamma-glutamyltransferase [Candidatus Velthaea sp.]
MIAQRTSVWPTRAVARSTRGMVATPHPHATLAGVDVLRRGGNAVDAAIAANAVLTVVYNASCGVGGDAFWIIYDPIRKDVVAYNGSGRTPRSATLDHLTGPAGPVLPQRGALSVSVPGAVRSWEDVARAHGTRGLDELLAPAETYARDGYVVTDVVADYLALNEALLRNDPEATRILLMRGLPRAGDVLANPDLAATLAAIRKGGADAFYTGKIAEAIVRTLNAGGNRMTIGDLASHRTERTQPVRLPWYGRELLAHPPNSQGTTMLMAMGMLEGDGAADDATWNHLAIEAMKRALDIRNARFCDPAFGDSGVEAALDPASLAAMRASIDPQHARRKTSPIDRGDTIFLCVVDENGGAVSLIESLYMNYGSGIVAEGTGIVLHNRGAYFSLVPGHPNVYEGGKRPVHTLSPPMVLKDGAPELVFGSMGGDGQPQVHVQLLHQIYDRGANVQQALDAPRWIYGRHAVPGRPDISGEDAVIVESRMAPGLIADMEARGHSVIPIGPYDSAMGHAHAIAIDRAAGSLSGGGDPRADSLAMGF